MAIDEPRPRDSHPDAITAPSIGFFDRERRSQQEAIGVSLSRSDTSGNDGRPMQDIAHEGNGVR